MSEHPEGLEFEMRHLLHTAALMTAMVGTSALAETGPVVVELYTSQGCSSCPPADAMLHELAGRDDVIPLALHVDYWDYIGWADEFADPEHTRRQQGYARAAGQTTIYTPQFVVGGRDLVIGAKAMRLADTIQAHSEVTLPVAVALTRESGILTITAEMRAGTDASGPYVIQLAQITMQQSVEINRGENAGKTISYSNIVNSLDAVHQWDGAEPVELQTDIGDVETVAVIVQDGPSGPVVGAAKLN